MYLNDKKVDTNIDSEFKKRTKKRKKIARYCFIGIIALILLVLSISLLSNQKKYYISLSGDKQITIYLGGDYIEPGYQGYDNRKNDLTSKVVVSGKVDPSEIGDYQITYTLDNITVTRNVKVVEKPLGATYIYLKGELNIYLKKGEEFVEPGYIAVDTIDSNLTEKIVVTNNVDNSKIGSYQIVYSVVNSSGITTSATRKVNVIDSDISLLLSNELYTNSEVTIKVHVYDIYFDYLILPNGDKLTKNETEYKVTNNGKYTFKVFNKKGISKESSIEVNTIDKDAPSGSCTLNIDKSSKYITVTASDNSSGSGISRYGYNGKEYTSNKINVNSDVSSADITIYDKAGNTKDVTCSVNKINVEMDGFILVGDSRFVGMSSAISGVQASNVYIVAKSSMGYKWFVETAINSVNEILNNNPGKKYYIFSNLGVNDLSPSYSAKLNELASGTWKGNKVGQISVNPQGGSNYGDLDQRITNFNNNIKANLKDVYYCDTYNGIGYGNFGCASNSDCLHYNKNTYTKIYNYIINNCKF